MKRRENEMENSYLAGINEDINFLNLQCSLLKIQNKSLKNAIEIALHALNIYAREKHDKIVSDFIKFMDHIELAPEQIINRINEEMENIKQASEYSLDRIKKLAHVRKEFRVSPWCSRCGFTGIDPNIPEKCCRCSSPIKTIFYKIGETK